MADILEDASIQTHKFLHDANLLSGSIDNLIRDGVDVDQGSEAAPQFGSVREMAAQLTQKLAELTE